jgi:hypothetical protein
MGLVAFIEFRDSVGRRWHAKWPDSDYTFEAPVFGHSLDEQLLAHAGSVIPLSEFYDDSEVNEENETAARWFPVQEGVRTLDAVIGSFEWFKPGEAFFSKGERVAGMPAEDVYAALKLMRASLIAEARQSDTVFRFLTSD